MTLADKRFKEMNKLMSEIQKYRSECVCGWMVTVTNKHQREICPNCGRYVYSNKYKFKEKLQKTMEKKDVDRKNK